MDLIKQKYFLRKKLSKKQFSLIYKLLKILKYARFNFYRILGLFLLFIPNLILSKHKKKS